MALRVMSPMASNGQAHAFHGPACTRMRCPGVQVVLVRIRRITVRKVRVMACAKELRFEWMDAPRGAAAILVLVRHYFRLADLGPVAAYIDPGTMGVVAFFCISGYAIPWSVLRSPTTVGQFMMGRAFRLYPAYWVSLVLAAMAAPVALSAFVANVTMVQRFTGMPDVVGVYWTLQIEVIFYALIAILMSAGKIADPRASLWCLWLRSTDAPSLHRGTIHHRHAMPWPAPRVSSRPLIARLMDGYRLEPAPRIGFLGRYGHVRGVGGILENVDFLDGGLAGPADIGHQAGLHPA